MAYDSEYLNTSRSCNYNTSDYETAFDRTDSTEMRMAFNDHIEPLFKLRWRLNMSIEEYIKTIKKSESDIFELKSYYSIAKSELAIKQYNDIITFLRFELTQTPNVRNRNQRNHMMVEAMRMVNIHDRMLEKLNIAFDIYLVDELKPDKYKSTIYDNLFRYINKNLVSPADQLYRFIQLNIRNNTSDYNRTFIQRYLIKCEIDLSVMLDSKNEDLVNWKTKMYRIFRKFFNENNTSVSSISSID